MRAPLRRHARWRTLSARIAFVLMGVGATPAIAACPGVSSLTDPIARAASRFAISEALIRAVIRAESAGVVFAVSPKGAMGLMQLMPGTWGELRRRYALGADPFDPCDNILAGTAYLRELLDRYGDPGFLAAYNAGPGRYEAYLAGRPLPAETIAYVAKISGQTIGGAARSSVANEPPADAWRRGNLFVQTPDPMPPAQAPTSGNAPPNARSAPVSPAPQDMPDRIFVPRTGVPR